VHAARVASHRLQVRRLHLLALAIPQAHQPASLARDEPQRQADLAVELRGRLQPDQTDGLAAPDVPLVGHAAELSAVRQPDGLAERQDDRPPAAAAAGDHARNDLFHVARPPDVVKELDARRPRALGEDLRAHLVDRPRVDRFDRPRKVNLNEKVGIITRTSRYDIFNMSGTGYNV
jgi:hypothetical protein